MNKLTRSFEFYVLSSYMILNLLLCSILQLVASYDSSPLELLEVFFVCIIVVHSLLQLRKTHRKPSLMAIDIVLLILLCLDIISTVLSVDILTSLTGTFGRDEGLYALIGYYLLFRVATNIDDIKEKQFLIHEFIILGAVFSISGLLSGWGLNPFFISSYGNVAAAPFGNPNFYGSFVSLFTSLTAGLYAFSSEKRERILYLICFAIGTGAVFACDSSSPLVANIMVFLMLIFICIVNRKGWKNFFILFLIYSCVLIIINFTRDNSVIREFLRNLYGLSEGLTGDHSLSDRMMAWKASIKLIPTYWLHGVGVDCFQFAMRGNNLSPELAGFDKAHNEYLQILITEGVFASVTYITFLFFIFVRGIKLVFKRDNGANRFPLALFLAFFGYIAQAFFNIRVIHVAIYFWIFCGLFYTRKKNA